MSLTLLLLEEGVKCRDAAVTSSPSGSMELLSTATELTIKTCLYDSARCSPIPRGFWRPTDIGHHGPPSAKRHGRTREDCGAGQRQERQSNEWGLQSFMTEFTHYQCKQVSKARFDRNFVCSGSPLVYSKNNSGLKWNVLCYIPPRLKVKLTQITEPKIRYSIWAHRIGHIGHGMMIWPHDTFRYKSTDLPTCHSVAPPFPSTNKPSADE